MQFVNIYQSVYYNYCSESAASGRLHIMQIVNVYEFNGAFFYELKDGTFYSTTRSRVELNVHLLTSENNRTIDRMEKQFFICLCNT